MTDTYFTIIFCLTFALPSVICLKPTSPLHFLSDIYFTLHFLTSTSPLILRLINTLSLNFGQTDTLDLLFVCLHLLYPSFSDINLTVNYFSDICFTLHFLTPMSPLCNMTWHSLQGHPSDHPSVEGERRRGRQRKSCNNNIKEWTGCIISTLVCVAGDRGRLWNLISDTIIMIPT